MSTIGRVTHVNISDGGVPKRSIPRAHLTRLGLQGDRVQNPGIHGGPDRAVCLYAIERIRALQAEGHPIAPGTIGENLTLEGIDFTQLAPGSILRIGETAVLEIVSYTTPCKTIARSFHDGDSLRIHQERHPGWSRLYARVLTEGEIEAGMACRPEAAKPQKQQSSKAAKR